MDNNIRLSIIIPFYNVEQYIAQCLDSVYQQDIAEDEYEVICVNDASPDHSRDIVLEYQKKHSNLVLVEHDVNKKLGAARNTGMKVATGRYIWHVDSDDMIAVNCLSELLKTCEENDLDVLEFGRIRFWGDKKEDMPNIDSTEHVVSGLDYMEHLQYDQLNSLCVVWRRLMKKEFLEHNCILSPEINMGEDVPYSFRVLMMAKRIMSIPKRFYLYRANPDSLTGSRWKPTPQTLYEKCFVDSRLIFDVTIEVPIEYAKVRRAYTEAARYTLNQYVAYLPKMTDDEQKEFKGLCRKNASQNRFVKRLLSRKRYFNYLLWLGGLTVLPK